MMNTSFLVDLIFRMTDLFLRISWLIFLLSERWDSGLDWFGELIANYYKFYEV